MAEIYKSLPVSGVRRIPYKKERFTGAKTQDNSGSDQARIESVADFFESTAEDVACSFQDDSGYLNLAEQLASQNRVLNEELQKVTHELETLQAKYSTLLADQTEKEEQHKNKGYEVGYRDGANKAELEVRDRISALVSAVEVFNYRLNEDGGIMQKESVLLAYEALILIVGEYYQTPEFLNAILRSAISKIADKKNLKLHLSRDDCDLVNQMLADKHFQLREISDIVADDRVKRGGCIIETENGIWDARLDSQLERIKDALVITMDGLHK